MHRKLALVPLLSLVACTESPGATETCGHLRLDRPLLVLENERGATGIGLLGTDGCYVEAPALELGADATLSSAHGQPFVCARDRGTITAVGVEKEGEHRRPTLAPAIAASAEGEAPPDPWDVDVDSNGQLWIARYDLPSVGLVSRSGAFAGAVSLGALADADGLPEADAIRIHGGRAFVALERLDRDQAYAPAGPGVIAAIDIAPPHAVTSFDLAGQNPFGRFAPVGGDETSPLVTIATPGDHDAISAEDGIEQIDLERGQATRLIDEEELGGSANQALVVGPTEAYAIVEGPIHGVNPTSVVAFDPTSRRVTRTLAEATGFYHAGLAVVGPYLAVGDRTPHAARIRFFERATGVELPSVPAGLYAPLSLLTLPP